MPCYNMIVLFFQTTFQPPSRPLSPIPKPTLTKSVPLTTSLPLPLSVPSNTSVVEPPLDFSSPAQFNPLDTSAARHRMSIKPRNQRASTKKKPAAVSEHAYFFTFYIVCEDKHTQHMSCTSLMFFLSIFFFFNRMTLGLTYTP